MSASLAAKPLRVGIAGLGTVGASVGRLIETHADLLEQRSGRRIVVTGVSARDRSRDRGFAIDAASWRDDPLDLAADENVDLVVEAIGGSEGVAKAVCERAIAAGKDVVTANKALLAEHGTALARQAEAAGVALAFEAAVAGGIPLVKAIREGLAGNAIAGVYGILNGTSNYILSSMRETGRDFDTVLREAQALGYAEADPAFDIDGVDAAHKLAILAALAFNGTVRFSELHVEGVRRITPIDIAHAEELGFRIKLLAFGHRRADGVELRVHPSLVPAKAPLAGIEGVFNAVVAQGDFVDQVMAVGAGAGAGPTASAVAADIVDVARGVRLPVFGAPIAGMAPLPTLPIGRRFGAYYLRLTVVDRPGVIAMIAAHMRDHGVSLESLLQRGRSANDAVPVVLVTHETAESAMQQVVAALARDPAVVEPPLMIRIETLA